MNYISRLTQFIIALGLVAPAQADPQLSSWFTTYSGKYARIYTNDAAKTAGSAVTTWTNGSQVQSQPAYCGIQQIDYDTGWVYVTTTGLGSHTMGPWLNGTFPNLPKNQKAVYKIPRVTDFTAAPATKTLTGGGVIGYFVDGVAMFDSRDAFYWNGSTNTQGTGYWNRDAYVNEGATFDPAYAHQQNTGTYHYHADAIALRYFLGDHVDYNATSKTYGESTSTPTKHSPILSWAADGYPIYGPYGYASALDATSGITRMRTGFVQRNGSNGTDNLATAGRSSLPQWTVTLGYSYTATTTGPSTTAAVLGTYLEDNAYLGDLIKTGTTHYQQGTDFDLDIYNGRYCFTPEYPGGVYAYFTAIDASGTPVFPYNIGRAFRGYATGATATVPGAATNYAKTGPYTQEVTAPPGVNNNTGDVTLAWSSVEGGTYKLEATSDLTATWTTLSSTLGATANAVQTSVAETGGATSNTKRFYRVTRTATAAYDGGGGTTGAPTVASSAATSIGSTTATLNGTVTANNLSTTASFEYGLTTGYGSTAAATPGTVTGNTATSISAALTGLTANTTYHFRAKGVNTSGTIYGSDTTFATTSGGGGTSTAPGGSATRGTSVTVTITLIPGAPLPPLLDQQGQTILPSSVTIADANVGTITGTGISRPAQNTVIATFAIPSGAAAGSHTISVVFAPPPGQQQGASYAPTFTFN